MFNIGLGELLFIAILVLVVVGPERLPKVMGEFGRIVREIRLVVNQMTSQFGEEIQSIQELQQPIQELRQLADDINPVRQVTKISLELDAKARSSQTAAGAPPLVKPDASQGAALKPPSAAPKLVKPTAAFQKPAQAAGSQSAPHPMKVLGQARRSAAQTPSSSDES